MESIENIYDYPVKYNGRRGRSFTVYKPVYNSKKEVISFKWETQKTNKTLRRNTTSESELFYSKQHFDYFGNNSEPIGIIKKPKYLVKMGSSSSAYLSQGNSYFRQYEAIKPLHKKALKNEKFSTVMSRCDEKHNAKFLKMYHYEELGFDEDRFEKMEQIEKEQMESEIFDYFRRMFV